MKLQYKSKQLIHLNFTDYEIAEINAAGEHFSANGILFSRVSRHIKVLKENNVSFSRLTLRLEKILKLGRDSSSKRSCFYRYGLKQGYKKFIEKTKASRITKDYYIEKHGEEKAKKLLSLKGASLENYIARHGETLGRKKWKEYKNKRKETYNKKRKNGHVYPKYNLEYFISLHGKEKGTKIYNKKIEAQRYKVSKQRYIDEYGEAGIEICREIKDNTSLQSFTNRYGKEKGLDKYDSYCKKKRGPIIERYKKNYPDEWQEKYNEYLENRFIPAKDNFVKRYGKSKGNKKYQEFLRKSANSYRRNSVSLISTELFDSIRLIIEDLENYGKKESTVLLTDEEKAVYNRTYLKMDCEYNGRVIEFNGDAFHANPKFYGPSDTPHPFLKNKSAEEIWQHDKDKRRILESRGYQVMYVWGSDYEKDKSGIIKECVRFLTT